MVLARIVHLIRWVSTIRSTSANALLLLASACEIRSRTYGSLHPATMTYESLAGRACVCITEDARICAQIELETVPRADDMHESSSNKLSKPWLRSPLVEDLLVDPVHDFPRWHKQVPPI